jgi:hypothetical protein
MTGARHADAHIVWTILDSDLDGGRQLPEQHIPIRTAAWDLKEAVTFSDMIALVRRRSWSVDGFSILEANADVVKVPHSPFERGTDAMCYAARTDKVQLARFYSIRIGSLGSMALRTPEALTVRTP